MNLFEIDKAIEDVIENGFSYDEETGEVFFTSDDLAQLKVDLDTKLNNIIGYIKSLSMMADNMKEIKNSYDKRMKTYKNKADSLKRYLDAYMNSNNKTKIETTNGIASYRKSEAVSVVDEEVLNKYLELHKEYANIKIEPNKTEIKKAIKEGTDIPGAKIVENNNLQIK